MKRTQAANEYVICIRNAGYKASLIPRRLYECVSDPAAKKRGLLRIVDETGEDYLYPESLFVEIALSGPVAKAVAKAG